MKLSPASQKKRGDWVRTNRALVWYFLGCTVHCFMLFYIDSYCRRMSGNCLAGYLYLELYNKKILSKILDIGAKRAAVL